MSEWGIHGARGAFQGIVEGLMRTLLEDHPTLLGERDISRLMDAEHCKGVLGLSIANFALLRHRDQGHMVQGHARYWKHVYAGEFYVCSQWWKDHHPANAAALSGFAAGVASRNAGHPGTAPLRRHIAALDACVRAAGHAPKCIEFGARKRDDAGERLARTVDWASGVTPETTNGTTTMSAEMKRVNSPDELKQIELRYAWNCTYCGIRLPIGCPAYWSPLARGQVWCLGCFRDAQRQES